MKRRQGVGTPGITGIFILIFLLLLSVQFWAAIRSQNKFSEVQEAIDKSASDTLTDQKLKQEAIALAFRNAQDGIFISSLVGRLAAGAGIAVTVITAALGVANFIDIRKREFEHTASNTFFKLWEGLADEDPRAQASSITGLSEFMADGYETYYSGTLSALSLVGRMHNIDLRKTSNQPDKEDNNIYLTLPIAEGALRRVLENAAELHPDLFKSTSWQGVKCFRADFSRIKVAEGADRGDLSSIDFRDTSLIESDFYYLRLEKAQFNAARLNGANFADSKLKDATFQHADLTGANFSNADLSGADLRNTKILDTNFEKADLRDAKLSLYSTDWRLVKNWREATLDTSIKEYLIQRYGPRPEKFRILMLLWEFPSIVSGGQWTAAYHFIRELRRRGANIAVFVPWAKEFISPYALGNEVEVYAVGSSSSSMSLAARSSYESSYQSGLEFYAEGESQYYASSRFELVREFADGVMQEVYEKGIRFDVIHAADWLTFPAAEKISKWSDKPWVAHFHSTEYERRPEPVNIGISKIEQDFAELSAKTLVPSSSTKQILVNKYGIEESKISVVPNCLSKTEIEEMGIGTEALGEFHSETVIFAGRLQWQKGIDLFVGLSRDLSFLRPGTRFCVYGRGEKRYVDLVSQAGVYSDVSMYSQSLDSETDEGNIEDYFNIFSLLPVTVDQSGERDEYEAIGEMKYGVEKDILLAEIKNLGFTIKNSSHSRYPFLLSSKLQSNQPSRSFLTRVLRPDIYGSFFSTSTTSMQHKGFKAWEKRSSVFENATVCVVPSRFEPFGMIVLEAMAHGVPVVYPQIAGVSEFLDAGISVDFEDREGVLEIVCKLLDDQNYWKEVVQKQRESIQEYYTRNEEESGPVKMLHQILKSVAEIAELST